jgi:hypothetical protein
MSKKVVTPPLKWELGQLPTTAPKGEYLLQTCTEDGFIGFDTCHFYGNSIDSGGPLNEDEIVAFVYLGLLHNGIRLNSGAVFCPV